ncbi:hypothetical protein HanOQP8_Chr11g0389301 [Helianthus annuus]|nr:hypothetical protein HanOQP8_Chr11g0389301 [Helianthus annuus]
MKVCNNLLLSALNIRYMNYRINYKQLVPIKNVQTHLEINFWIFILRKKLYDLFLPKLYIFTNK